MNRNMSRSDDPHRYDDMINLPHPDPKSHPRMSLYNRAAQFSPFAALTGYGEVVENTAKKNTEYMSRTEYYDESADLPAEEDYWASERSAFDEST